MSRVQNALYDNFNMQDLFQGGYCRANSYLAQVQQVLTDRLDAQDEQLAQLTADVAQQGNQLAQLTANVAEMNANIHAILHHLGIAPAH